MKSYSLKNDQSSFFLDNTQLQDWHITYGNLNFKILSTPPSYREHGSVIIDSLTCSNLLFSAKDLTIRDCVYYHQRCYDVVEMADCLFADCLGITGHLYLNNTLTSISDGCFSGIENLEQDSIAIPPSIKHIGALAFDNTPISFYYLTSNEPMSFDIEPFGFETRFLYVNDNLLATYNNNINLKTFYYIQAYKQSANDDIIFNLSDNTNTTINIESDKYIYENIFSIKVNANTNPALKIEKINLTTFDDSWITISQSPNLESIDLYANKDAIPTFPNSYCFLLKIYLYDTIFYVSQCFTVNVNSYAQDNTPKANYMRVMCNDSYIDDNFTYTCDIKTPNKILNFDIVSFCFYKNAWPQQTSRCILMLESQLTQYAYFDNSKNQLILKDNILTGKYTVQLSSNSLDVPYFKVVFYIDIIQNKKNNLIVRIVVPIVVVVFVACAFIMIFFIVRYKKTIRRTIKKH